MSPKKSTGTWSESLVSSKSAKGNLSLAGAGGDEAALAIGGGSSGSSASAGAHWSEMSKIVKNGKNEEKYFKLKLITLETRNLPYDENQLLLFHKDGSKWIYFVLEWQNICLNIWRIINFKKGER